MAGRPNGCKAYRPCQAAQIAEIIWFCYDTILELGLLGMLTVFGSTFLSIAGLTPRLAMGADTVMVDHFSLMPGGRGATQALAAHLAGAKVRFASAVGQDEFGNLALDVMRDRGLDLGGVKRIPSPTGLCTMLRDFDHQLQCIISRGASGAMVVEDIPEGWLDRWTTLLVQGETNESATMQAIGKVLTAEGRCILHLSPLVPISESVLDRVDYLILSETEAVELAASFAMRTDSARAIAFDIAARRHGPVIIMTKHLDIYVGFGTNVEHIPHAALDVVDTLGAEDALVGVFAAGISQGLPLADVLHRAVAAAALTASKPGLQTALPEEQEIDEIARNWPSDRQPAKPSLRRRPVA
jgi:ribokinase